MQRVPSGREDPRGRAEAQREEEQEASRDLEVTWLAGEVALCAVCTRITWGFITSAEACARSFLQSPQDSDECLAVKPTEARVVCRTEQTMARKPESASVKGTEAGKGLDLHLIPRKSLKGFEAQKQVTVCRRVTSMGRRNREHSLRGSSHMSTGEAGCLHPSPDRPSARE